MQANICTADTLLIDPGEGKRKAIVVTWARSDSQVNFDLV